MQTFLTRRPEDHQMLNDGSSSLVFGSEAIKAIGTDVIKNDPSSNLLSIDDLRKKYLGLNPKPKSEPVIEVEYPKIENPDEVQDTGLHLVPLSSTFAVLAQLNQKPNLETVSTKLPDEELGRELGGGGLLTLVTSFLGRFTPKRGDVIEQTSNELGHNKSEPKPALRLLTLITRVSKLLRQLNPTSDLERAGMSDQDIEVVANNIVSFKHSAKKVKPKSKN